MTAGEDLEYYSVLGLKPGASVTDIKTQYRRMAKQFHPDRNAGDAWHQEHLKKIIAAYEVLSDPDRKAAYDLRLAHVQRADPKTAKQTPAGIRPPSGFLIAIVAVGLLAVTGLVTFQHQRSSVSSQLPVTSQSPPTAIPVPLPPISQLRNRKETTDTTPVTLPPPSQKSPKVLKAAMRMRFQTVSSRIDTLIEAGTMAASSPVDSSASQDDASRAGNVAQLRTDLDTLRTKKAQVASELDVLEKLQIDDPGRAAKLDLDFHQLDVPYQAVKADLLSLNSLSGNTNASH
jgi:hypothetical protein